MITGPQPDSISSLVHLPPLAARHCCELQYVLKSSWKGPSPTSIGRAPQVGNDARIDVSIYEQLGIEPIINASGAVTRLGGAPMSEAALAAFREAAAESVPLDRLQGAASKIIAEATGTEAGLVTAGAAAALTLGAAAMLTRDDLARMERLPRCEGFPDEIVVAREHRNGYDHAVRASGARLVEVGFHESASGAGVRRVEAWEYEAAFGPRTAGVFYVLTAGGRPPLADVVRACACASSAGAGRRRGRVAAA